MADEETPLVTRSFRVSVETLTRLAEIQRHLRRTTGVPYRTSSALAYAVAQIHRQLVGSTSQEDAHDQ